MIWTLRYKAGTSRVRESMIDACDRKKAILVGQAYCRNKPGYEFVSVVDGVVADESILDEPVLGVEEDREEESIPKRRPGRPPKNKAA